MINKKKIFAIFVLAFSLITVGCMNKYISNDVKEIGYNNLESEIVELSDIEFSAWATYWDQDQIEDEINSSIITLDNILHFGAYFDEQLQIFIPEATILMHEKLNEKYSRNEHNSYLTIVNDIKLSDGSNSLKDTDLLYSLIGNNTLRQNHVTELIKLALDNGYDGLEIDYEAIRDDTNLWRHFEKFVELLYKESLKSELSIRVVLEPSVPINEIDLPSGPEYVMMCYNLHGYNTKPGPKADDVFIESMIEKMKSIDSLYGFAFATGGFDWSLDKTVSITEIDALALIEKFNVEVFRDDASMAVYFNYTDEVGNDHEVWFADTQTLNHWFSIPIGHGYTNISLWRLGGNSYKSTHHID